MGNPTIIQISLVVTWLLLFHILSIMPSGMLQFGIYFWNYDSNRTSRTSGLQGTYVRRTVKEKAIPLHAMQALRGREAIAPTHF
jgi:hypothetical protein